MATQKPISSISYNSEPFLREKLEDLYKSHIISAYQYISHKGEDGDKDHIHFRIEPNKRIDPMEIQDVLREYVVGQPKPLGCLSFRPSREEDWFLYAVHDPDYMKIKYSGDKNEKIPYDWSDIRCNEGYMVETVFIRAKQSLSRTAPNIVRRINSGEASIDLVSEGANPFTVSQIVRLCNETTMPRVRAENDDLRAENAKLKNLLDELTEALENHGFEIFVGPDGKVGLNKFNPFI